MSRVPQISRVGVVAKRTSSQAKNLASELVGWLTRRDLRVKVDEAILENHRKDEVERLDLSEDLDLVVVLGGDGTLLSVARQVTNRVPILGVNLGTLGFLTEVSRVELFPALVSTLAGQFEIEERSLLDIKLERSDGSVLSYRVLNDAVITKSALARIIELNLTVDGDPIATYRSDGVIISTPTGSTAYNLSAGGPIVSPQLPVVVVTPICAHTFSLRPIVVPDSSLIEARLQSEQEEVYLTLDGQEGTPLNYRDKVSAKRSEGRVRLVKTSGRTFYDGLRDKLHWGE
jgi:NAD+ kinase